MRILRSIQWLVILLTLCSVSPLMAGDAVEGAVTRLSTVGRFAFGHIGFAGVISDGEIDFKLVLAQPKASAANSFERLYAIGNPQGKSYALSGLKKLAPQRFAELLKTLGKSSDEVEVMRGCVVSHEALSDVARQIDHGKFLF